MIGACSDEWNETMHFLLCMGKYAWSLLVLSSSDRIVVDSHIEVCQIFFAKFKALKPVGDWGGFYLRIGLW